MKIVEPCEECTEVRAGVIVGECNDQVLRLNERAYTELQCKKSFAVVPNATHLLEEPGTLPEVARLAAEWFQKHFQERS